MKKKRITGRGMILVLILLALTGCGKQPQAVSKKMNIGVACYDLQDTFLSELLDCFKEDCSALEREDLEITVSMRDAAISQRTQNDQVKELIHEGCDVLCINLADRTDPSEIIDMAREADVPIIFWNREPVEEDMKQWDKLYYVGAPARQSGIMQGELAADAIWSDPAVDRNGDGKIQYVILEGEMGHQDAILRTETAVESLKEKGIELEKLSYGIANWNRAQAQNRMQQMIGQYQDRIELVLSNNDEMALGALEAYEKMGYAKEDMPLVFGIDGTREGLRAVKESRLSATVYNDKEGQAKAMANLCLAAVTGEGMENMELENHQYSYLPYHKVNQDNVDQFYEK